MNLLKLLKDIFARKKVQELKGNPVFIINHDTTRANGHRYLVCNSADIKSESNGMTSLRYIYTKCYPRDVDQNLDINEKKEIMNKSYTIPISVFFVKKLNGASKFMEEHHLLPKDIKDLPGCEQKGLFMQMVTQLNKELDIETLYKGTDITRHIQFRDAIAKVEKYQPKKEEPQDRKPTGQML